MKLATHRTTKVPRKGPTIVQQYKKKLEEQAKADAMMEKERLRDVATRDHLGITRKEYRRNMGLYFSRDIKAWEELKARRTAQALQGPQLPAPKDFQVELMHTQPLSWWRAIKAAFFNPYPNPH